MVMRLADWFTPEDAARVEAAIAEAETHTSAEIVAAVAAESDDYPRVGLVVVVVATLAAVAVTTLLPGYEPWHSVAAVVAGAVLGVLAVPLVPSPLRVFLAGNAAIEASVRRRALEVFADRRLQRTTRRTGVLLYVSLMERRLFVWADDGVGELPLDTIADAAAEGLGRGEIASALIESVAKLRETLAASHPPGPDNPDELPNAVVILD